MVPERIEDGRLARVEGIAWTDRVGFPRSWGSQLTVRTQAHVVLLPPGTGYQSVGDSSVDSLQRWSLATDKNPQSLGRRRGALRYTYTSLWLFPVLHGEAVVHPTSRMFMQHHKM